MAIQAINQATQMPKTESKQANTATDIYGENLSGILISNNNPKKTPNNNPINAIINLTPIVLVLNNHFLKFALFL